jgi:hypothetical protein
VGGGQVMHAVQRGLTRSSAAGNSVPGTGRAWPRSCDGMNYNSTCMNKTKNMQVTSYVVFFWTNLSHACYHGFEGGGADR